MVRIVHYLNQFFAGIGGEDKADIPVAVISGPVGPGIPLEREVKGRGIIIATIYAGDNYANEHSKQFVQSVVDQLRIIQPDVIIAGPAFNAGRYGLACGSVLKSAHEQLGIPGVTAFGPDNPGIEVYRKSIYIVPTERTANGMSRALPNMARIALGLGSGLELGSAQEEGYLPRGIRRNIFVRSSAAVRAIEIAIERLKRESIRTELGVPAFDSVPPPPPLNNLSEAIVALVTEGGIVPAGNPDHLETQNASKWFHYELPGRTFKKSAFEGWHGGYVTKRVNDDPDRNIPLDAMRTLEQEGFFGRLYHEYCVTTGNAGNITTMRRIGSEIADYLKKQGVEAVVLTAT